MTKFFHILKRLTSHWDIYIPWGLFLYCYTNLYFFYYQIGVLIIFPFIIKFYKEKYYIQKYFSYSKKTKINCICFGIVSLYCLIFIFWLPFFKGNMMIEKLYEQHTFYSCSVLNNTTNEELIFDYNHWQNKRISFGLPTNLDVLIEQISNCKLKNKKDFLIYLLLNPTQYTMGYNNSFVAIPIKHAFISLYNKPLPVFDSYFPDNNNGIILNENELSTSLLKIKKEINNLN
jgi:hypothetical protein